MHRERTIGTDQQADSERLVDKITHTLEEHDGEMQECIAATGHHFMDCLQSMLLMNNVTNPDIFRREVYRFMETFLEVNPFPEKATLN